MKLNTKNYILGITFFILSILISTINDILTKYLSLYQQISISDIVGIRCISSTITLLPFYPFKKIFYIKSIGIHILRGLILSLGLIAWSMGIKDAHLVSATVINFLVPIITILLSSILLKENVEITTICYMMINFTGILFSVYRTIKITHYSTIYLAIGGSLFALLDIINKKFIHCSNTIDTIFYSSIFSSITSLLFMQWNIISMNYFIIIIILGINANLILFFLIKSFSIIPLKKATPYRYIEFIFTASGNYIIFSDPIAYSSLYTAIVIVISFIAMIHNNTHKN